MRINADARTARRQSINIPANSVYPVAFLDSNPNSVYIKNNGDANIYVGFHFTPTSKANDLKIRAGMAKTYGEQNPFGRMLIFNESSSPANVIITSWEAALFDPTLLQGDIDLTADFKNTPIYDGVINGFTSELPEGNNHLGTVSVDNDEWTGNVSSVLSLLEAIRAKETGAGVWTAQNVDNVLALLTTISQSGGSGVTASGPLVTFLKSEEIAAQTTERYGGGVGELVFFINDGPGDLLVRIYGETEADYWNMSVYAGESLNGIKYANGFAVISGGDSSKYRLGYEGVTE